MKGKQNIYTWKVYENFTIPPLDIFDYKKNFPREIQFILSSVSVAVDKCQTYFRFQLGVYSVASNAPTTRISFVRFQFSSNSCLGKKKQ